MLLALTLLLSATALTGCGGDSGESSDGPVSLTLSLWDEAQLPVIQENVDAFNAAHEGEIKVNIEQIPWDTYWTKLDASLETNEAPDVFWMNTYVQKYVDAGVLEPLDSYIEGESFDMSVYAEGRVNAYNVNGQQYALPKGLDAVAVALNTELFDRYGVELPQEGWTWDDQLRDAIAAAGGSEYPIVMELDAQPSWMNFLYQNGGNYLSDDGKTCGIALPESKDAIQQVVDLMNDEQMAPYSVLTETGVLEDSSLAADGNVQLIQMPSMAVDNKTNMGGLGYVMSANCENKEAAWELMKYITGEEAMSHEAEEGIDIPAYLSAQEGYVANFKNINAQVFMDASANGFAYPSNGNFDWTTIVDDAMQEAFGQVKTVDEAMDEGAAEAQAILDEGFG